MTTILLCVLALQQQSIPDLIEQLRSPKQAERVQAEAELRKRSDPDLLPALEKAAKDPDVEVALRAKAILESIVVLRALTPRYLARFPDARERLSTGPPHGWTDALLEATAREGVKLRYPDLQREDLLPLARLALRAALPPEKAAVLRIVAAWRLSSAASEIEPITGEQDRDLYSATLDAAEFTRARFLQPRISALQVKPTSTDKLFWLELLGGLGCRETIPDFLEIASNPRSGFAGARALDHLIALDAAATVPLCITMMREWPGDPGAYPALLDLDPVQAASTMQALLEGGLGDPRRRALNALRGFPSPRYLPTLLKLCDDADDQTRALAVGALDRLDLKEHLPAIRKLLDDPQPRVRRGAAKILARHGNKDGFGELSKLLRDPESSWGDIRDVVPLMGRDAIPDLQELRKNPRTAEVALEWLDEFGVENGREQFVLWLKSKDGHLRARGAWHLARVDGARAAPLLIPLLRDRDFQVRHEAFCRLYETAREELLQALQALVRDPAVHADLRGESRWGLETLGIQEPLAELEQRLEQRLEGDAPRELSWTLSGLKQRGTRDSIPKIRPRLTDPVAHIRRSAAETLASLGDREALPVLMLPGGYDDQFEMNSMRNPELWAAWRTAVLKGPPVTVGCRGRLEEVARQMKVAVEGADLLDSPLNLPSWTALEGCPPLAMLKYLHPHCELILEPGRIRVLSRPKGRRFWLAWYADELLKSPLEEDRAEGRYLKGTK